MSTIAQYYADLVGAQNVSWAGYDIGATVDLNFTCYNPADQSVKLSLTALAIIYTMKAIDTRGLPTGSPIISHEATITNAAEGECFVEILSGDTAPTSGSPPVAVPIAAGYYWVDVWAEDVAGNRLNLGSGLIPIGATAGLPNQTINPGPAQNPLAQGPQGIPGTNGSSFVWRGVYNSLTTYAAQDVVSYASGGLTSSYICILASTGNLPTNATYWGLMAEGETGPTGPAGPTGATGATGASGSAPVAGVADAAIDQYALVKVSGARYVMLGASDDPQLMVGVAFTAAAAQGDSFMVTLATGTNTVMLSDGTATITANNTVIPSTTVAGRVKQGTGVTVGSARTSAAATLDAQVTVL